MSIPRLVTDAPASVGSRAYRSSFDAPAALHNLFAGPVVVFCAHTDDEALSCGGLVQRLADSGVEVHVQWLTYGVPPRPLYKECDLSELSVIREQGRHAAIERLGLDPEHCGYLHAYRTAEMDGVLLIDLTRRIEDYLRIVKPRTVLTHWSGDPAQDHRRVTEAVVIATRPKPESPHHNLLMYETLSNSEWTTGTAFTPNVYVPLTAAQVERKVEALSGYKTEIMEWPHPRSRRGVETLAAMRGMQVGVEYAEAYMLVRSVAVVA